MKAVSLIPEPNLRQHIHQPALAIYKFKCFNEVFMKITNIFNMLTNSLKLVYGHDRIKCFFEQCEGPFITK